MQLAYTRAMVTAALNGDLDGATTVIDPVFGFAIPTAVPGVPGDVLIPRATWQDSAAYDAKARDLVRRFHTYMAQFADQMSDPVRAAAPQAP
jgi:phosphoenolpyruvate carboxykinase (ATP)